jgi:nucleotide-binding universal stress UspA family protein
MKIQRILWPTDLSRNSLSASDHVVSLAEKYGAEVVLLYVAPDLTTYFPAYGEPGRHELEAFRKKEIEHATQRMEKLCQGEALSVCPKADFRVRTGDPALEILGAVTEENADMVVMTTHGAGREDKASHIFGAVADKVVKHSPAPVVTINPYKD